MQTDELLTYLSDGQSSPLVESLETWLASSRRFAAFATTFRDKIRKKLRTTQDQKNLLDLQLELETAYLLLQERALSLAYEPEQSKGIRSPDFAVTFTTSLTFMVEVTRVQAEAAARAGEQRSASPTGNALTIPPWGARLADVALSKLGQLAAQRGNVLLIGGEAIDITGNDLRLAMLAVQQRAERSDPAILERHGFLDRAQFFQQYQRLSEIIVRLPHEEGGSSMVAWSNPQARHPLPSRIRTVLHRSLAR